MRMKHGIAGLMLILCGVNSSYADVIPSTNVWGAVSGNPLGTASGVVQNPIFPALANLASGTVLGPVAGAIAGSLVGNGLPAIISPEDCSYSCKLTVNPAFDGATYNGNVQLEFSILRYNPPSVGDPGFGSPEWVNPYSVDTSTIKNYLFNSWGSANDAMDKCEADAAGYAKTFNCPSDPHL